MNKYFKAISTNLIFMIVNIISFLVLTPLAIHSMGDEFYGLWSILYSVMLFSNIGTLGISSIVNKFAAEASIESSEKHNYDIINSAFSIILPMAIITTVILWLASGLIAKNMNVSLLMQNQFRNAIRICAIGIVFQFLAQIPQGFFLSQYRNNIVRSMDFIANIFPWIGAILISIVQKNLMWIALWFGTVQLFIIVIYTFSIRNHLHGNILPKLFTIRRIINFSFYMFIESIAISIFQQLDKVIVGFILGPSLAGVYSVGTSVGLRMSIIVGQVTEVMIPYASLKNSIGDNETLFSIFRKMSQYISLMVAAIGSFLIIWMHEILTIWISPDYAEKYYLIFSILILAYGILSLCRPAHQTLQGIGQVRFSSMLYLFSSILMLTGVYVFSSMFEFYGAALANILMIFLLGMNLRTYLLFDRRMIWKEIITDQSLGVMLPIITCAFVLLSPSLIVKVCFTLILIIWLVIIFLRDSFAKAQILKMFKNITQGIIE